MCLWLSGVILPHPHRVQPEQHQFKWVTSVPKLPRRLADLLDQSTILVDKQARRPLLEGLAQYQELPKAAPNNTKLEIRHDGTYCSWYNQVTDVQRILCSEHIALSAKGAELSRSVLFFVFQKLQQKLCKFWKMPLPCWGG